MDFTDKRRISAIAQILIAALNQCDDGEFVTDVIEAVQSGDFASLKDIAEETFNEAESARETKG